MKLIKFSNLSAKTKQKSYVVDLCTLIVHGDIRVPGPLKGPGTGRVHDYYSNRIVII